MAIVTPNEFYPLDPNHFSGGRALSGALDSPVQLFRILNALAEQSLLLTGNENAQITTAAYGATAADIGQLLEFNYGAGDAALSLSSPTDTFLPGYRIWLVNLDAANNVLVSAPTGTLLSAGSLSTIPPGGTAMAYLIGDPIDDVWALSGDLT